jgi:predicted kinase
VVQQRPRIVLITGAPGSGKTTLGQELSRRLQVPFLARDDVRRGLFFTAGAWGDSPGPVPTGEDAVEAFLRILETTAASGVSCIAEYVVRRGRDAELQRVTAAGDCVVVRTACRTAIERFADRHRRDRLLARQPVLDALGYPSMDDHAVDAVARMRSVAREMRTDVDLPLLTVRTDDGYEPGLDAVLEFVTQPQPPLR